MIAVLRLLRFVLTRTFVDPVREGRLSSRDWPPGLRPVVTVGVAAYVVLVLAAVGGAAIRRHDRLLFVAPDETLPASALPLLTTAFILALACLFTAALHLRLALRAAITLTVVAILLSPVDWTDLGTGDLVVVACTALLVFLAVVRARRRYHWGELVVSLVLIGGAVVGYQVVAVAPAVGASPGLRIVALGQLTDPIWALAAPVSLLAGAAVAEITVSAATWTTAGVWRQLAGRSRARRWAGVALAVLATARIVQEAYRLSSRSDPVRPAELGLGVVLAALVLGATAVVARVADRTEAGEARRRPDPDDLLPVWKRCLPLLALLLGANVSLQLLVSVLLRGFGLGDAADGVLDFGGSTIILVDAVVTSAIALVAAVVVAFRGWRSAAVLLTSFGAMFGLGSVCTTLGLIVAYEDVLAATTAAALGVLAWLVVRRRLTAQREVALAGVLGVSLAYPYRDWFTEPFTQLVSLTGVSAALLVGLVWRILTDNGYARGDSPGFPQPSRVLLALANALVGVTFAALLALLGGQSHLDLSQTEQIGDNSLGFPLLLAVVISGLALAARAGPWPTDGALRGDPTAGRVRRSTGGPLHRLPSGMVQGYVVHLLKNYQGSTLNTDQGN